MTETEAHQKQIQELQLLEQTATNIAMQKQNLQVQLSEIETAIKELDGKEKAYKIVGQILVESDPKTLVSDLSEKKEVVELRLRTFEKQETKIKDKMQQLQQDVLSKLKE